MKLWLCVAFAAASVLAGAIAALAYHSADLLAGAFMKKWPLL